ncbi:hypothetical protein B0A49_06730 [Cryomyces minteri]|uniref:Folic acid synthesis protein FOL1 n=1 Tax=Cryomyces minteri TaxID=331657 RepID=A0A4U0XKI1_9PEZI|nr:hypothetical protein B0A49_06730 [Cryomyces minteri]
METSLHKQPYSHTRDLREPSFKGMVLLSQSQSQSQNGRSHSSIHQPHSEVTSIARGSVTEPAPQDGRRSKAQGMHRAYIALGSNVGDRIDMVERACNEMAHLPEINILRTSGLWETKAMYVENQNNFVNGACEVSHLVNHTISLVIGTIETTLSPTELLDKLQGIETMLGRLKTIDKGPRNIDLDILLYDDENINLNRLKVPHPLMLEREFVLRPLCELIPQASLPTPHDPLSLHDHLSRLPRATSPISTLTPIAPSLPPLSALNAQRRTHVMSILNLTPDSFSDGGLHLPSASALSSPSHLAALKATILAHIAAGATILDVGGQSSRPNAPDVSADKEAARVVPVVRLIRSLPEAAGVAVSVDTYRASVAAAAVNAGADIVNDISAGLLDPDMLPTVARLGCTVCLMHMRGTPATMTSRENCTYPHGVIPTVASELLSRIAVAEAAGVRRWRIILDPGIGFAKTQSQNLELLRRFGELRNSEGLRGLPWLVGTSRKGFIGRVTGEAEARDRTWGTAVTVAAAVQGGADVVRVHDVAEMVKVCKMGDAIWRA